MNPTRPGFWLALSAALGSSMAAAWAGPFDELVRPTDPLTAEQEGKSFHLPPGFEAQLVVSEPVVNKPMNLAFDERGRLWATSSAEYPWAVKKEKWKTPEGLLESSKDKILIIEDTNGDGLPDKPTIFADNLNVATGVLPYKNGCIAWSIPNIWRLEDTDGDGKCDKRTILFGPLGWEKDTHGMISSLRLAPDGWIYATHGFSNTSHFVVRPEHRKEPALEKRKPTPSAENWKLGADNLDFGNSLDLQSGSVFRFLPDGSRIEPWGWGQVNPFGLTFDRMGFIYTADCHSNPITQVIRGAYYPSFGKPDGGLGFGPVLCEHSHGSTGICGPLYIDRGVWGPEWDDHMIVCNPVTSRINHDKITFTGSTPKANELPDFLSTDDPWFRPVDIRLGPDGALYIADFYNKIIGHYEVPLTHPGRDRERGRIWRVAKKGVTGKLTPLTMAENEAAQWRWAKGNDPATVERAAKTLSAPGTDPRITRHIVEYLSQWPSMTALPAVLEAWKKAQHDDASLMMAFKICLQAHLHLPGAFAKIKELPGPGEDALAFVARAIPTPEASGYLLGYLRKNPDDPTSLAKSLSVIAKNLPGAQIGELAALAKEKFPQDAAVQLKLFNAIRAGLAQRGEQPGADLMTWGRDLVATAIAAVESEKESGWSQHATDDSDTPNIPVFGADRRKCSDGKEIDVLSSLPAPRGPAVECRTGAALSPAFACPETLSFWLCGHRGQMDKPPHEKSFVRIIDAKTGQELSKAYPPRNDAAQKVSWDLKSHAGKQARIEIVDGDTEEAYAWLAAGRFDPPVVKVDLSTGTSLAAVADMVRELKLTDLASRLAPFFGRPTVDDTSRAAIAKALATFPGEAKALGEIFKTAPTRLQTMLAEAMAGTREGAETLCAVADPRLLQQPSIGRKISALNVATLNQLVTELTKNLPPPSAEAGALIAARIKGFGAVKPDLAKGEQIYMNNCALCHKIGAKGTIVGPQLDGAGSRGLERLCEDILDPNRAVDPAFHLRIVKLKDGSVLAGLQRRVEGETVVLADVTGKETAVQKSNITENAESPLSLMPPTFGLSIPEPDFYNMLAWLLSKTQGK